MNLLELVVPVEFVISTENSSLPLSTKKKVNVVPKTLFTFVPTIE